MKIDTSQNPFIPGGWTVEEHIKGGKIDLKDIELYLDPEQSTGIEGNKLREKLRDKNVLNAVVLDYLLKNKDLIPEEWKSKAVFFWGTIYRYSNGDLCVRYLVWFGSEWHWNYDWLGSDWSGHNPAASRKSLKTLPSDFGNLNLRIENLEAFRDKVEKILKLT
jgi:hypothetical protein